MKTPDYNLDLSDELEFEDEEAELESERLAEENARDAAEYHYDNMREWA